MRAQATDEARGALGRAPGLQQALATELPRFFTSEAASAGKPQAQFVQTSLSTSCSEPTVSPVSVSTRSCRACMASRAVSP